MKQAACALWKDESAATFVEYAVVVTLIAIICIVAVTTFGTEVEAFFQNAASKV